MTYETFRALVYCIGVPIIIALLVSAIRRIRAINAEHQRLLKEEAEQAKNPYADMARMYEARELLDRAKKGKQSDKPRKQRNK